MSDLGTFFRADTLSCVIGGFIAFFTLLVAVYSAGFMKGKKGQVFYYANIFLTFLGSLGAVFARNFLVFVAFWGFLGLLLYLLVGLGEKERTSATAKKTLIIVGGTDAVMLLGLAILWRLTGSFDMGPVKVPLDSGPAVLAYLCLACGALAKAGAMPFHSWIPDVAEDAPVPVAAFLPASLDKLLGIYFLTRLSLDIFAMNQAMNAVLLVIGSFTIVAAVMMALVQHDFKRLLGYHAVSQVGYMVVGIGTGNPIGIAGGLFHMLNHAVYKACLFLTAGAVEKQAGTTDLEKMGGLSREMPITFVTFLAAAFAISGVPPLNGFASKWMVYQGIIDMAGSGGKAWVIWLIAAMFGSALTLASFMKLAHAVFLGQPSKERKTLLGGEASWFLWLPGAVLAVLCVVFGVFALAVPLKWFVLPSLGQEVAFTGLWRADLATALLCAAIAIGAAIYFFGNAMTSRETPIFVGGESAEDHPDMRLSGTDFYRTVRELPVLGRVYDMAEKRAFDPYDLVSKAAFFLNGLLRYIHNGVLSSYLSWFLLGVIVLFAVFFMR